MVGEIDWRGSVRGGWKVSSRIEGAEYTARRDGDGAPVRTTGRYLV